MTKARIMYMRLVRLLVAYLHVIQAYDDELLRWIRPRWLTSRASRPLCSRIRT